MKIEALVLKRHQFSLGPLSFDFGQKGLYFIQGKNGSGKTSLMRALMGRLSIYSGQILRPNKAIGFVGAEKLFFETWSLENNIHFLSSLLGQKAQPEKLNEIKEFMNRKISSLSEGQRRKSELFSIFSFPFEYILLDEPKAHLDKPECQKLEEVLIHESQTRSILISIHDHSEIFGEPKGVLEL